MDLKALKAQVGKLGDTAKELKEKESVGYNVDERIFKPTKDGAGNISCVIRFLPQLDFVKSPYVEKYQHFINAGGKTFVCACINNGNKTGECLSCAEAKPYWSDYWAARNLYGNKDHPECKEALKGANKFTANKQTLTNIMVVTNPAAPETEGKVFLYSMPKVVVEKYRQKLFPKDDMDEMVLVYHPFEGRNFKLDGFTKKVNEENTFMNYDDSYFYDKTTPISDNDERVAQIINEAYDLDKYLEEIKPDKEDINRKFNEFKKFLGLKETAKSKTVVREERVETTNNTNNDIPFDASSEQIEEVSSDDIDKLFSD